MKKKLISVLLVLTLAITLLAGCAGTATTGGPTTTGGSTTTRTTSGEATTIKLALWDYDIAGSVYPAMMEEFAAKNSNIEIEIVNSPSGDYETKLTTML
ncbi:MAG TPA: hypothetical protein DCM45_06490, partial [Clostridiales bacterium]|nr:hypothetical protein [Clostridiales bacterium]